METTKSLVAMRTRAEMKAGKAPGPGGSLGKLAGSVIHGAFREIAMEIAGAGSQAWDPDDDHGGRPAEPVVGSFSSSIAGGTDEIQRNIIGDRVLGLPRDISVDTNVPFKDLKVGTGRGRRATLRSDTIASRQRLRRRAEGRAEVAGVVEAADDPAVVGRRRCGGSMRCRHR